MLDGIRGLAAAVAAIGILLTLAGYFGRVHPGFDTLGAFRLQALAAFGAIFVFSLLFGALTARYLAMIGALFAAIGLLPALQPEDPVGFADIHVYSHNLRFDNATPERVEAAIRAADPEVVLLQEVSDANRAITRALADTYRTEVICAFAEVGGVAVLARYPMIGQPGCASGEGVAWARLRTPDGPLTVVSIHLPWPWPYGEQAAQAGRVAELLRDLDEPLLIGGDFNIAPWSYTVRRIEAATGTRTLRGFRLSFRRPAFWPGLPLDHVLTSEDLAGEVEQLGPFGSDHAALLTGLRFLRPAN